MGKDFNAILGHSLDREELYTLCDELNSCKHKYVDLFISELIPYNLEDISKEWSIYYDRLDETVEINGPCGLSFHFSDKVCLISHYTRWKTFLLNDLEVDFRKHLRNVSYGMMKYLSASYVIYVPDSGAIESGATDCMWDEDTKDIEYIKDWLQRQSGEPKAAISDIYNDLGEVWDSIGYYMDYFNDYEDSAKCE